MKRNRIVLGREVLVTQMNHWALFPLAVAVIGLAEEATGNGKPNMMMWCLCSLLPLGLYLVRQHTRHFWQSALCHLAVVGVVFLLPAGDLASRILYIAFGVGYVVNSLSLSFTTEDMQDKGILPPFAVGVGGITMYLLHYQGNEKLDSYFVFSLIAVLGMYFLKYYVEQYLHFLVVNESSAGHIPEREMFHSGMGLAVLYTVLGVAVLGLTANAAWLKSILNLLLRGVGVILRFLFSLLPDSEPPEIFMMQERPKGEGMVLPEPGEPFWLWIVLEKIAFFALGCLLIAGIFYGLIKIVQYIRSHWKHSRGVHTPDYGMVYDVREKCEIIHKREKKKKERFDFFSPKERIRRIYKKQVLSAKKVLVGDAGQETLMFYTAQECGHRLAAEDMADIYEKPDIPWRNAAGEISIG